MGNKSILENIRKEDVDLIYMDKALAKRGYKFYYIIDADDLKNYCDPYGKVFLNNKPKYKSNSIIADLEFSFGQFLEEKKERIILLKYYYNEINTLRTNILNNSDSQDFVAEQMKNDILEFIDEVQFKDDLNLHEVKSFLNQKYTIFHTYVKNQSESTFKKLQNSFDKKILFQDFINNTNDDNLKSLFVEASNIISKPYSRFDIESIHTEIRGNSTSDKFKNDAYSILFTFILNHLSGKKGSKSIFIFISSLKRIREAFKEISFPNKSNWSFLKLNTLNTPISKILKDLNDTEDVDVFSNYHYLRQDKHLFIDLLSSQFYIKSDFQDFVNNNKTNANFKISDYFREKAENNLLFFNRKNEVNFEFLKARIESLNKEKNQYYFKNRIKSICGSFIKTIDQGSVLRAYKEIEFIEKEFLSEFKNKILNSDTNDYILDRGMDKTDSILNVLPFLFYRKAYKDDQIVTNFVKQIEKIFLKGIEQSEYEVKISKSELDSLLTNYIPLKKVSLIGFILIPYLVSLIKFNDSYGRDSNLLARIWLKKIIDVFNKYKESDIVFKKILPEAYILLCSVTRRCRHYREAFKLNTEIIENHSWAKNDPRFYHSLSLISYNWLVEYHNDEYEFKFNKEEVSFDSAIRYAERAFSLYEKTKSLYNEHHVSLMKSVITNNIATFICSEVEYIYGKEGNKNLAKLQDKIINARKFLFKTKSNRRKGQEDIWPPTYLHTESYTEYWELILGVKKTPEDIRTTYFYALKDIKDALKIINNESRQFLHKECEKVFTKLVNMNIDSLIDDLNSKSRQ